MIRASTAVLAVEDVQKSVDFYCNILGFQKKWLWENPPTFGCIGLGATEIFLSQQPALAQRISGHQHCFFSTDIQTLHDQHVAAGAPIVSPLENKPWGIREYTVRDPSGYHLRFAGPPTYDRPATATDALPAHVRIEPRLPTLKEYADITAAVGWNKDETTMPETLRSSRLGVVAIDMRDNSSAGMLHVTGDGRYFMIWDVMVVPPLQGQRIGTAMIETAIAELRKAAKQGAFVGLFTAKPAFYERLGFKNDGGMHLAL